MGDEVKVSQDDESTSWAFVAAKESHKKGDTASAETRLETSEHAPALVVEIIEKEKKVETIDKEGYKVVKGKNKVKKTNADVNEKLGTVDLIKELDQPLEPVSPEPKPVETKKSIGINLPVVEMTDDWMDDAVVMGSMDSDEEEYDDDDMETQMLLNKKVPKESPKTVKEGRLSALAEAQKFSCDEEDEEAHV